MMDWTDRHYRAFVRGLSREALLYSEMVTTAAVLRGDRDRLLGYSDEERPLALQLGGDDPRALAECARIAVDRGYDEVNLNVGCPSERVQNGNFGVCLMAQPERVARAVEAMRRAVTVPVTVKHRIGVDDLDRYEDMARFVETVAAAGADRFIVHARKAWLGGLSPKENRTVPPLRYADVYRLKREHRALLVEINGGVVTLADAEDHLEHVDGVMLGRAAYQDSFVLAGVDARFYGGGAGPSRREAIDRFLPYIARATGEGVPLNAITRHLLGLVVGRPGAKAWRRHLSEHAHRADAGVHTVLEAMSRLPDTTLDERPQPAGRVPA